MEGGAGEWVEDAEGRVKGGGGGGGGLYVDRTLKSETAISGSCF